MLIPLTKGLFAIVDAEDFDRLSKFKWCVSSSKASPHLRYALRTVSTPSGPFPQYMHREILNAPPGTIVDHKNGNTLDNRRKNLRLCSAHQNLTNSRKRKGAFYSTFKGVSMHKKTGLWTARIQINNKPHHLGYFKEELDAHNAYAAAAKKFFGDYARLK